MKLDQVNGKFLRFDDIILEEMTLEQYLLTGVSTSRALNIVQECSLQTNYNNDRLEKTQEVKAINIQNLKDQFLSQCEEESRSIVRDKKLDRAISKALKKIPDENYLNCLIKIRKNEYIIGTTDADCITLRCVSHSAGCILIFKPEFFQKIEIYK